MIEELKEGVSVAQIVGVLVAIGALWWQIRRARLATNVELILKFDDKFNREDFRTLRGKAAAELRGLEAISDAEDVFDFFETLGYLVRRKVVAKELAWHTFYEWVHGYWSVGCHHVINRREERNDPHLWRDFELLHKQLLGVERKNRPGEAELLSAKDIEAFLLGESDGDQ